MPANQSCEIFGRSAGLRQSNRPQRGFATSGAQNAVLVHFRLSGTSTSTRICHLGCSKHSSGALFDFRDVDLNEDLPPRVFKTPFWCNWFAAAVAAVALAAGVQAAIDHNIESTKPSGSKLMACGGYPRSGLNPPQASGLAGRAVRGRPRGRFSRAWRYA